MTITRNPSARNFRSALTHGAASLIIAGLGFGLSGPAHAADPVADPLVGATAVRVAKNSITVGIGKSTFLDLKADARDVIVTNPSVVQATIRSERKMMLLGLGEGETQVYVMDAEGRRITSYTVQVSRDTGRLEEILREVIPGSTIRTKMIGKSVILSGEVDSDIQAKQAVDVATAYMTAGVRSPDSAAGGAGISSGAAGEGSLGPVISALTIKGRDQVMLKVTIAEIQRNVLKQLGIKWTGSWSLQDATINGAFSPAYPVAGSSLAKATLGATWPGGDTVNLEAMEQAGVAHTLAEPTLTAISGESASFLVGGEMPVPSGTSCSGDGNSSCQPTITYKKFGVSLNFTPVVLSAGKINLKVGTEVSEIDPNNQIIVPAGNNQSLAIPGFKVRKQDTTVEMPSGAALVTAGLIQQQTKQAVNGLPGLMDLPILGTLFRSRDYQRQETELVIIVTPYLAKPIEPQKIARPDDGFAPASEPNAVFLGHMNRKTTSKREAKPIFKQPGFIIN
ncbi:type II and III secretion system protein family protein [Microvirga calopogonii]|uniref:type II and III secretion system protein family protein n=1 Tax=Microvirga calopogonii TaxID=2078013 RepID=UPI000E0D3B48|nr:type II and III secretion system protein family protein [Microvirga calopogonii]